MAPPIYICINPLRIELTIDIRNLHYAVRDLLCIPRDVQELRQHANGRAPQQPPEDIGTPRNTNVIPKLAMSLKLMFNRTVTASFNGHSS